MKLSLVMILLFVSSVASADVLIGDIKVTDSGYLVFSDSSLQNTATLQGPPGPQGPKGDPGTPGSLVTKEAMCQVYSDSGFPLPPFCLSKKIIFVTGPSYYDGALGGLQGADQTCQTLATTAGLTGTFKAWLSDSTTAAADRLTHHNGPYVRTDGVVVANDWKDLTDGWLKEPILYTENHEDYVPDDSPAYWYPVWSNTKVSGAIISTTSNCSNWTSNNPSEFGWAGDMSSIDGSWTNGDSINCDEVHPLYCIEQ
jgi:hypothetical protein